MGQVDGGGRLLVGAVGVDAENWRGGEEIGFADPVLVAVVVVAEVDGGGDPAVVAAAEVVGDFGDAAEVALPVGEVDLDGADPASGGDVEM